MTASELVGVAASLTVLTLVWWPIRLAIAQRTEVRFASTHRRNADGVIAGAEPIHLRGVRPGAVLLLHGYNDSPQAVSSLANALHDAGWTVYAPLLAGHGRSLEAFAASGAEAWLGSAREGLARLLARHDAVAVSGLSMGGALAFTLAAEEPRIRAVVGIAPYVRLSLALRALLPLTPIAQLGARYVSGGGRRSVHDPAAAAAMIAYRTSTPRLLRELARTANRAYAALPHVRQGALVIQSREDNRIPARLAASAFQRIGSPDKELVWTSGAGHVITVDYGYADVERRVVGWLGSRLP